ncbi:hypothetical protein CULC0102_0551 [Corynebacterium ulcerans 0102]|nr:hypothetical protein CULC0102_0551 [Corynebacterium ulcerans 0102]
MWVAVGGHFPEGAAVVSINDDGDDGFGVHGSCLSRVPFCLHALT